MYQITLGIDGMMCGMCESHINDAVRNAFPVKKVSSSHSRGETVILSETAIPEAELRPVIAKTGYELINIKLHFFFLGFFNKFLNIKDADIFSCFIFFTRIVLRAIPITILTNIGKISSKWMLPITAYQYFANF